MKRIATAMTLALLGCGAGVDEGETGAPLAEAESALTQGKVAAMNSAAKGTAISYVLSSPPNPELPQTLAMHVGPHPVLRRVARAHLADNSHVADIVLPPDPCDGDSCQSPAIHLGRATTAWVPPDPCDGALQDGVCRTGFDIAGANLRIVGNAGDDASGSFVTTFQVLDGMGNVVFDSQAY